MRSNNEKESFALRLRQRMEERGLTQVQLAALVGVAQSRVSEWRAGKAMPQARVAEELADQLYLNVEWLIDGTGLKEPSQKSQFQLSTAAKIANKLKEQGHDATLVQAVFEASEKVLREAGAAYPDWQQRTKDAEDRAIRAEKKVKDLKKELEGLVKDL